MKHLIAIILAMIVGAALNAPSPVWAAQREAEAAGMLAARLPVVDQRSVKLQKYLEWRRSPMAEEAAAFVAQADRHSLDWRLVAAIAGLESTFGRAVPSGSYNAWGWGIPTGASSGIAFASWEHGIATVSEGLRQRYIDEGNVTIEQIGRIYAASPTWA